MEEKRRREGDKERMLQGTEGRRAMVDGFCSGLFAAAPSCDKLSNLISGIEQVRVRKEGMGDCFPSF